MIDPAELVEQGVLDSVHTRSIAPAGYVWRWVPTLTEPSNRWRMLRADGRPVPDRGCRWGAGGGRKACGAAAVAELNRARPGGRAQWWAYCADHLYGRRVHNGQLQSRVLREVGEPPRPT